jgi:D-tyrosyl-tRNA(Tyr) deacylase
VIALLQRVAEARVEVQGRVTGRIGPGLLLFVCAESDDTEAIADKLVDKVLRLRIFSDAAGKMNLDLSAVGRRAPGRQPVHPWPPTPRAATGRAFSRAAGPELGRRIYERVLATAPHATARWRTASSVPI